MTLEIKLGSTVYVRRREYSFSSGTVIDWRRSGFSGESLSDWLVEFPSGEREWHREFSIRQYDKVARQYCGVLPW